MKRVALVIVLFVLFAAVAVAAIPNDDKDFRAGLKSYNSKNYKAAVKHFKEYISKRPDPAAYYLIGYSLYELGKFGEADDYFREAYLVDPEFSLEKVGLMKKASGEVAAKERSLTKMPESVAKTPEPVSTDAKAGKPDLTAPPEQKAKKPETVPAPSTVQKSAIPSQSAPPQAELPKPPQTVPTEPTPVMPAVPPMTMPTQMPAAGPAALIGIIAAMGMIIVVIAIAFYIYFCLCMYLIAKKLDVPAPWTAWIPLVQIWTFVTSAGKPAWWIILLFIPLVNFFVSIYLWMCITENLGKNKWLGLLILVPLVGILYPGWLAFSKTEGAGGYTPPDETLSE
jgi:hypothetical protein